MTVILGIDPGSRITGFGIITSLSNSYRLIHSGCIRTNGDTAEQRLWQIFDQLENIIAQYKPQEAAIEQVFLHKNFKSALKLGQARGVAMAAMAKFQLPVAEYSPRKVKQAVIGYGAADKKQIQYMERQERKQVQYI